MNFAGRTIAILGCGYLGSRVARQAVERGMEVSALTRNAAQAERLRALGVQRVIVAELDATDWHAQMDSTQDFVLDCVGSAGLGLDGYRRSYLEGMRSLLQWSSGGAIGTMAFTSSTSVYTQNEEQWVTENDPADGSSEGSRILLQAEALLREGPGERARRFVLRLGGIYGPGRHHLLDRAARLSRERKAGDQVILNPIHVEDAAGAIWAAFACGSEVRGGIFNIVDDSPARKAEILDFLQAKLEQGGLSPSGGEEAIVSTRRAGLRPSRKISNEKARRMLGWSLRYGDYQLGYEPLIAAMLKGRFSREP